MAVLPKALILLLAASLHQTAAAWTRTTLSSPDNDNAERCRSPRYKDLYANIDDDLRHWKTSGISLALMNK